MIKNIFRNAFPSKHISLGIEATTFCDRGCSHCSFDANTKNRKDFKLENVSLLVDTLKHQRYNSISVCFTGGGEPLLSHSLIESILVLRRAFKKLHISIVTSGCLSKDGYDSGNLIRLLELVKTKKIKPIEIWISYNLFNSSSAERLRNTLEITARYGEQICLIGINVCSSLENIISTNERFNDVTRLFGESRIRILPSMVRRKPDASYCDTERACDLFGTTFWSENNKKKLRQIVNSFCCDYWMLWRENGYEFCRKIKVSPFSVGKIGRAKSLPHNPWPYIGYTATFWNECFNSGLIHINAGGLVFIECDCSNFPEAALCRLDEMTPDEIFRYKKAMNQILFKRYLLDKRPWNDAHACEACITLRRENHLL